jgi:xylulokinase
MSLIGIDVGSSSVKIGVYRSNGKPLAQASETLTPRRPEPGWWEIEPEEVLKATLNGLHRVSSARAVRRDPPVMMAISASGREAFPVDQNKMPLGPCIMAGDIRGAEFESSSATSHGMRDWYSLCGHLPERMDPVNRLLWWRCHRPAIMNRAKYFLGWHEFLTLHLGGVAVTDRSLAGKWLIFDLALGEWSPRRLAEFDIDPAILPSVRFWGDTIAEMESSLVSELGFSSPVKIAVGGFDASCATLGSGALAAEVGGLVSGSWEDLIVPTDRPPSREILSKGMSLGPHPGSTSLAVFALSPNGTVVLDWARSVTGFSLKKLNSNLESSGPRPSPVLAIPHFSGATVPWGHQRESRGTLTSLTLASSPTDITKALMEGIAYDLCLTLRSLSEAGMRVNLLRAAGGGTRSNWWTQLKADLLGVPIEVTHFPEVGTLGAALLAGLAAGDFSTLEEGAGQWISPQRRYEPDPSRASLHREHLEAYQETAAQLVKLAG